MNLLALGAQQLADAQKSFLGVDVVLRSAGGEERNLVARVRNLVYEVEVAEGRVERWESRAFTFDPTDLTTRPREGDEIREAHALGISTYRIMAPPGIPPVHYADAYRTSLIVHGKLVSQT